MILAIIIVIALIVVSILSNSLSLSGNVSSQSDLLSLSMGRIGVVNPQFFEDGASFTLVNNEARTIRLQTVSVGSTECTIQNPVLLVGRRAQITCVSATPIDIDSIIIEWEAVDTGAVFTENKPIPGSLVQPIPNPNAPLAFACNDGDPFHNGTGTSGDPFQLCNWEHLDNMRTELSAYFVLVDDIGPTSHGFDTYASSVANSGAGWEPVGTWSDPFSGTFDGQDFTIDGLFINRSSTDRVAFFGVFHDSLISNTNFVNLDVTGRDFVGSLVAGNQYDFAGVPSFIENVSIQGVVRGEDDVGGIIAEYARWSGDRGVISNSHFVGDIFGDSSIGGIVSYIYGFNIFNSSFTGYIEGIGFIGGLVPYGEQMHLIGNNVTGVINGSSDDVGGALVMRDGNFLFYYNTIVADVYGDNYVGGIFGSYSASNWFESSTFIGNVFGNNYVGGVTGQDGSGRYENLTIIANVTGTGSNVGGFAGSASSIQLFNSTFIGEITGDNNVGGMVGEYWGSSTDLTTRFINVNVDAPITGTTNVGGVIGHITGSPITSFGTGTEWYNYTDSANNCIGDPVSNPTNCVSVSP